MKRENIDMILMEINDLDENIEKIGIYEKYTNQIKIDNIDNVYQWVINMNIEYQGKCEFTLC